MAKKIKLNVRIKAKMPEKLEKVCEKIRKRSEAVQMNYTSPRWSGEITDCSMPMTFDQYDHCSYNCLYCFSWFQKALKAFNPLFPNEHDKDYQSSAIRSVNPDTIKRLFDLEIKTGSKSQFNDYIRQRVAMQWGGLSDPFDGYEKQHGIGLEVLKHLKKHHYPVCFSTKATWWTEDDRYMRLFHGEKNWNVKFSIINLDEKMSAAMEKGVPTPRERLLAMKRVAAICPGGVTLRLRPFIIGMTDLDDQYIDLIKRSALCGASAISTEFFCLEDRAHRGTTTRYDAMSEILGFDIRKYYKINSPRMCGYLRLNWKLKEPYVKKMQEVCHSLGMRFYISDAHWKDQCDGGSCCGLPESFNYSRAQYTELLQLAQKREDGLVYWSDMGPQMEMFKKFYYRYAEGFNTIGSRSRTTKWNDTMYDYLHNIWNKPNSAKSPYKYFGGLLQPVGNDKEGNVIYKYRPYRMEE